MEWLKNEIDILVSDYEKIGPTKLSEILGRTSKSVQAKAKRLNLKYDSSLFYKSDDFDHIVSSSANITDLCRNIGLKLTGGNRKTVKKWISIKGLDTSHFHILVKERSKKYNVENILVEDSTYTHTSYLKNRLYKEGLKHRECELCGQGEEWRGKKMSLILDHINGVNNDNRIENLRIVCPNCNATLDTHGGKNIKMTLRQIRDYDDSNEIVSKSNKCLCGKRITLSAKRCVDCDKINQRKVERPPYDTLIKDIKELGYSATGRKYGVSDNSIRKWVKYYES